MPLDESIRSSFDLFADTLLSVMVSPSVVIVSTSVVPANVTPPLAVTVPVMFISPVPVISKLLRSKLPPS